MPTPSLLGEGIKLLSARHGGVSAAPATDNSKDDLEATASSINSAASDLLSATFTSKTYSPSFTVQRTIDTFASIVTGMNKLGEAAQVDDVVMDSLNPCQVVSAYGVRGVLGMAECVFDLVLDDMITVFFNTPEVREREPRYRPNGWAQTRTETLL